MEHTFTTKLAPVLGEKTAKALEKSFGVRNVGDLLEHFPRRYLKRGELSPIQGLPLGESVTIVAEVRSVRTRQMRARSGSILEIIISDGEGILTLTFFNQPWRQDGIKVGDRGLFSGKISTYQGKYQLAHPEYEIFPDQQGIDGRAAVAWAEQPVPIYPATAQLASWQIERAVSLVLDGLAPLPEILPSDYLAENKLVTRDQAFRMIHQPATEGEFRIARKTLAHNEAVVLQVGLLQQKRERQRQASVSRKAQTGGYLDRLTEGLPYELTPDQVTSVAEIAADLAEPYPMSRLLHGEVGSGKTLVALIGMLTVADSGGQSALLAPTEVLAAQHLRSIVELLGPELTHELKPVLLTGQMSAAERRKSLLLIAAGEAKIVVGTHALFAEKTQFYDLSFVIIDEQHRFGVDQRELLRQKGENPNLLVLSATPIPRTVALTLFGDLEISTIQTMPTRRAEIVSHLVPLAEKPWWKDRIWQRMAEELAAGRQGFVVAPAIDPQQREEGQEDGEEPISAEDTALTVHNVAETYEELLHNPALSGNTIAVLHGRMTAEEKDRVMTAYAAGEIDLLVATTVIEVGVNVPNASMMVVLSADRFGIAQLHQLRGRIGRGEHPGLALFVTEAEPGSLAYERIAEVAATIDGFELAKVDLELRREGDVLGSSQSGYRSSLKILRVTKDTKIIVRAREFAEKLLDDDPTLAAHPELRAHRDDLNEEKMEYLGRS